MRRQGEYDDLISKYYQKQAEIEAALSMRRLFLYEINDRFHYPTDAVIVRVNYLGWGRNAWHSTWINQYHPGTIDCDLKRLQRRAEKNRTQGSQLWIETRDALWLNFENANIMIVEINKGEQRLYEDIANFELRSGLKDFWNNPILSRDNWLLFFELGEWRPDLVSKKKAERFDASSSGSGRTLHWIKQESELNKDFFDFSKYVISRLFPDSNKSRNR